MRPELETEAQRADAQYRAAMHEAFGAQATVVIDVQRTDSGEEHLTVGALKGLGLDKVIVGGSGAGTGALVVVPDRLSTLAAPQLLELWALPEPPTVDRVPAIVRRCVESGKHLPVLRFAAALDRTGVETLMRELADVGAAQPRNATLRDLALLLDEPEDVTGEAKDSAVVAELDDALTLDKLKVAAAAALADPDTARAVLSETGSDASKLRGPASGAPGRKPRGGARAMGQREGLL